MTITASKSRPPRQIDLSLQLFYKAVVGTSVLVFGFLALWLGLTDAVQPPYFNVAFTSSWVISCLLIVAIMEYGRRRPQDAEMTWGEAVMGAAVAFFLMFWIYGVLPHLFLSFADNELSWRQDRRLIGPILPSWWADGQGLVEWALPFQVNYRILRDILASGLYGAALVANCAMFIIWQKRDKPVPAPELPQSKFGRPLVSSQAESNGYLTGA